MSAYEELMRSVDEYSKGPGGARDRKRDEEERKRKEKEAAERAAEERKEAEKRGGTRGRSSEGHQRRNELFDAINSEKKAADELKLKRKPPAGMNGIRG